ncbi:hypothetical protein [Kribbella sp. NPDC051718]|uniref:hypothetical protein n=1 Tax=Kribbella sp. NPDC051718 TaxID=3155168 RepID=UPI00341D1A12
MTLVRGVVTTIGVSTTICLGIASSIVLPEGFGGVSAEATIIPGSRPSPKPTFSAGKSREGTQITGWSDDHERFVDTDRNSGPRRQKAGAKEVGDRQVRRNRDSTTTTVEDDLRLHDGLCGHSPTMASCLPAMEDDRPDQPNLPVTTPSMAVAERIPRPEDVTWDQVLREAKAVVFPRLKVKVQPTGRTLVNQDTIVYTDKYKVYSQTVTVLGFPVEVQAAPSSYTWNFGDGATLTTSTPGNPYPSKDITHKYMKKAGVNLTVTVGYEARYNVADTGWRYIGTVPITGPATALRVREAVPVLVGTGR